MRLVTRALTNLIGVTLLVFLALRLAPGDPVELMLGETSTPADREVFRQKLELDRPPLEQLGRYLKRVSRGDLGHSIASDKSVSSLIGEGIGPTTLLAFASIAFSLTLGVPFGVLAAARKTKFSGRTLFALSLFFVTLPAFWLAPLLIMMLGLRPPWLPVSGFVGWRSLILPVLAVGLGLAAYLAQTTRAAVSQCLSRDYIRTAVAKGASETRVLFLHALPNAAIPVLTVAALQFGHLLAGAVIIETIFDWPGIGKLMMDGILARDYPVVQGVALVVALIFVVINTMIDAVNSRLGARA